MLREIEERERPAKEAKLAAEKKISLAGNNFSLNFHFFFTNNKKLYLKSNKKIQF